MANVSTTIEKLQASNAVVALRDLLDSKVSAHVVNEMSCYADNVSDRTKTARFQSSY